MRKGRSKGQMPWVLCQPGPSYGIRVLFLIFIAGARAPIAFPQTPVYPKEIRGYKVERAVVEVKRPENRKSDNAIAKAGIGSDGQPSRDGQAVSRSDSDPDADDLIKFGKPELARITPLGITVEVPIVVSPVTQSGHVDFLMFEDMVVNGTSVEIGEYHRAFDLPNKNPLTLHERLSLYIYLPNAMLAAIGEWNDAKETWPVTGRIYVFGKFKKALFSFKRCIPVELKLTMRNPLKDR